MITPVMTALKMAVAKRRNPRMTAQRLLQGKPSSSNPLQALACSDDVLTASLVDPGGLSVVFNSITSSSISLVHHFFLQQIEREHNGHTQQTLQTQTKVISADYWITECLFLLLLLLVPMWWVGGAGGFPFLCNYSYSYPADTSAYTVKSWWNCKTTNFCIYVCE